MVRISHVSPSGDMARKAWYDRNPSDQTQYYNVTHSYHDWTERLSYTIPSGKKAMVQMCHMVLSGVVDAGYIPRMELRLSLKRIAYMLNYPASPGNAQYATTYIGMIAVAGQNINMRTINPSTTQNATYVCTASIAEFAA